MERPSPKQVTIFNREALEEATKAQVAWADRVFRRRLIVSTSFGIQSAVILHLVSRMIPDVPVVFVDTGYLVPETYRYAEQLMALLRLNVRRYSGTMTPAEMEAKHGKLWETDLDEYHRIRKVEPMRRAIRELEAHAWIAGLRADQTSFRATLDPVTFQDGVFKVHPILRWRSQDVYYYMEHYRLPQHPLWEKGFTRVGDRHSSSAGGEGDKHARFDGRAEECGLHTSGIADE
ncbi:MAG: phosphoadenylyl-sulfate reductase [Deltaproteobacteria bacterium]|nr:phosphoadenylyl-sulfate reductase [Deltaproteobacteria bacterium]